MGDALRAYLPDYGRARRRVSGLLGPHPTGRRAVGASSLACRSLGSSSPRSRCLRRSISRSAMDMLGRVLKLQNLFKQGHIPTLVKHEVHPGLPLGSRDNYLYFTLPPSLNFQRQSPAMWSSALQTYEDPETHYVFSPEETARASRKQIQKHLLKHKLALQPNKHTDIWIAVSKALHAHFKDDPRELFRAAEWDV